jgi:lipopolysaccharide/colanic/teichoic acid biosynthesis glycosyltransferase
MFDQTPGAPPIASKKPAVIPPTEASWIASTIIDRPLRERRVRGADLLLASALILFTLPLAALVGVAIKLDSAGPIFSRELRRGRDARPYSLLKFRTTISSGTSVSGSIWQGGEQVARVGVFLRYTRIEELPQLLNVLRGEMTLIGMPGKPQAFDS